MTGCWNRKEMINKSGEKNAEVFTGDNYAWKKLLETKALMQ